MGAIEDLRKVMQDFLTPELRGIDERLKALDNGLRDLRDDMHKQFAKAEQRNETRLETAEELKEKNMQAEEKIVRMRTLKEREEEREEDLKEREEEHEKKKGKP
jgi:hypothetical protein